MKELSIEEKAKAYDKIMGRAKKELDACGSQDCDAARQIFRLFPELREESEDEKMIKSLIRLVKAFYDVNFPTPEGFERKELLAWLEKQGEKDELIKELSKYTAKYIREVICKYPEKQDEQKDILKNAILDSNEDGLIAETIRYKKEKQSEQKPQEKSALEAANEEKVDNQNCVKPDDRVEPKFGVGDWVVNIITNDVEQIIEVTSNEYICSGVLIVSFDNQHLLKKWSIQYAKDGDVLHSIGWDNDCIFIFNGLDRWKFDAPNGDRVVATGYCCLSVSADNMEFGIQGPDCIEVNTVKPATKIQRDLLFQKMKEAGYEWDSEKKELEKIEQEPAKWTEKDEDYYDAIIAKLEVTQDDALLTDNQIEFLKSLKPQLKQEWSEKDKEMIENIRNIIAKYAFSQSAVDVNGDLCEKEYIDADNWLKNLKDRVQPQNSHKQYKRIKPITKV